MAPGLWTQCATMQTLQSSLRVQSYRLLFMPVDACYRRQTRWVAGGERLAHAPRALELNLR